ncbi:polyphosphate kinase 1 [Bdellovibrionota bacterium FG-1]
MFSFNPALRLRRLLIDPAQPFIHRDLSWLQFNSRVLAEAKLETNPLLERVKFLSISSSNLDEFFMIRMAALGKTIAAALRRGNPRQLQRQRRIRSLILGIVRKHLKQQAQTLDALSAALTPVGIHIVSDPRSSNLTLFLAKQVFDEQVFPELSPPEPYGSAQLTLIDNSQFAVFFQSGTFLRIPKKVKPVFLLLNPGDSQTYLFFLDRLLEIFSASAFRLQDDPLVLRLTRDADLSVDLEEEDPESVPDVVISSLSKRERGRPVRIQYRGRTDPKLLNLLQRIWRLSPQQVFEMPTTMCLPGLWPVLNSIPEPIQKAVSLIYPPLRSLVPNEFKKSRDIFEVLKKRDFLLHHPYDSFDTYVNWIRMACEDPSTTTIQQTVYRMDALSPVVDALKSAAGQKKIRVVIELRARFDEFNNLRLAEELRNAGVEVVFGFGKLKLHAKIALVTRQEGPLTKLYTHLSTGNYNSITARQYTDLAILTANQEIGEDAQHFFDSVSQGKIPHLFKRLVPAPTRLHRKILQLIEEEILAAKNGKSARIVAKVNTLVDHAVIQKLYLASNEGVTIDLIVRGACALIPGIKGLSENIRVFSIVDRLLEHSRIYYFESSNALYLSSADWMPRNFFSRLELAFPILDKRIHDFIVKIVLPTYLQDRVKAQELTSDGTWQKRPLPERGSPLRSQFYFDELATQKYKGTPLEFD